jgi:alkylated DNA nucleotide flippase Atl1
MTAKTKKRKSWREKLADSKGLPKVVTIEGRMSRKWGEGTVVVPAPVEVDEVMRMIPKGKITTINHIREFLAARHHATVGCPITTGIFAWISANAAAEAEGEGRKRITPYWRTLKGTGELNPKYPGGVKLQAKRLKVEGIKVSPGRGKKPPFVAEPEQYLHKLPGIFQVTPDATSVETNK